MNLLKNRGGAGFFGIVVIALIVGGYLLLGVPGAGLSEFQSIGVQETQISSDKDDIYYDVVRVIDGDTIDVRINGEIERVRLVGVDAPERKGTYTQQECYGDEAKSALSKILDGNQVRLVSEPQQQDRDKYGRLLRYVYLPGDLLVNAWLIENGYAQYYRSFSYGFKNDFIQNQKQAEDRNVGIWSACL